MNDISEIKEHMRVVGSDGQHVGTVDCIENDEVKLAKNDPESGGQHHTFLLNGSNRSRATRSDSVNYPMKRKPSGRKPAPAIQRPRQRKPPAGTTF
jgi:hypothetical protein